MIELPSSLTGHSAIAGSVVSGSTHLLVAGTPGSTGSCGNLVVIPISELELAARAALGIT
jgi:hypothetical protein